MEPDCGYLHGARGRARRPAGGPPEVEGAVWVKVAILVPCDTRCPSADPDVPYFPDGFGLYLLQPDPAGGWQGRAANTGNLHLKAIRAGRRRVT